VGVDSNHFRRLSKPSGGWAYDALLADIDTILAAHGMKWVFIFDQINRIFDRPDFQKTKDVGVLLFPFRMMKRVLKPGRIISIISGSSTNELSHREYHLGFKVFEHPTQYDKDEIEVL
ncbi:MAG: hypothetical protein ACK55Z_16240, partial [bacterium]